MNFYFFKKEKFEIKLGSPRFESTTPGVRARNYTTEPSPRMKNLFAMMFTDSAIAQKISVGSAKLSYMINHGLAPYFHNSLTDTLESCSEYVVYFDEATW